jgi:hypothetical protein
MAGGARVSSGSLSSSAALALVVPTVPTTKVGEWTT